jgi:hypothetical protein
MYKKSCDREDQLKGVISLLYRYSMMMALLISFMISVKLLKSMGQQKHHIYSLRTLLIIPLVFHIPCDRPKLPVLSLCYFIMKWLDICYSTMYFRAYSSVCILTINFITHLKMFCSVNMRFSVRGVDIMWPVHCSHLQSSISYESRMEFLICRCCFLIILVLLCYYCRNIVIKYLASVDLDFHLILSHSIRKIKLKQLTVWLLEKMKMSAVI